MSCPICQSKHYDVSDLQNCFELALDRIATLEQELEEAKAHPDCLRCLDLERDRDADRAALEHVWENLKTLKSLVDNAVNQLQPEVAARLARATQPNGLVPRPDDAPLKYNGGIRCDMDIGPCACGAWHLATQEPLDRPREEA